MGYYKICQVNETTWYIAEPLGVGCFLFVGAERSLLLDTCNGFRDIRKVISRLTNKPLVVLNSHGHADHAGGNSQFRQVHIHAADLHMTDDTWQKSQRDRLFGYARAHYPILRPVLFWLGRSRPHIYDTEYMTVEDGSFFELGGKTLEVIHFPGHSPGSIILSDKAAKTLYVGDSLNNGMFLFFEHSPPLKEYAARLRDLASMDGYDVLWTSHSKQPLPFSFVEYYADFLERVTLEKSEKTDIPNDGKDVYLYKEDGGKFGLPMIAVHYTKDLRT